MDTFNVLIPGAGGPAGINTIKSLRLSLFKGNIVSTDSNSLSAGFFLSDFIMLYHHMIISSLW